MTIVRVSGGSGAVSGYTTVQDDGLAAPARAALNFVGSSVSVADYPTGGRTNVTVEGEELGDFVQRLGPITYFYTTTSGTQGNYWDRTLKYGGLVDIVIVNPASGPGTTVDSTYTTMVQKAQASGCRVLGYVTSSYATKTAAAVNIEIDTWRSLYPAIDGIFIDESSNNLSDLAHYQSLYAHVKSTFPARSLVVTNPGTTTDEAFMAYADILMTFEGDPATYRARVDPAWERKYPAHRFWHVVHTIASLDELREMVRLTRTKRAGLVYFTNDVMPFPYGNIPNDPWWSSQVAAVTSPRGIDPAALPDRGNGASAAGGVETLSRFGLVDLTGSSGRLWVSYFTATIDTLVTQLMISSGGTAAATCTLARLALFTVATDGSLTLVARTASDTAIGGSTFSVYERSLSSTGGYPTSYTLTAGARYAIGFLQVASTACSLQGAGILDGATDPVPSRIIAGQTDIATSYAVGTLTAHFQLMYGRGRP